MDAVPNQNVPEGGVLPDDSAVTESLKSQLEAAQKELKLRDKLIEQATKKVKAMAKVKTKDRRFFLMCVKMFIIPFHISTRTGERRCQEVGSSCGVL